MYDALEWRIVYSPRNSWKPSKNGNHAFTPEESIVFILKKNEHSLEDYVHADTREK